MIEKAKTVLLVLLVGTSLLQSYLLAFHSTDYEAILESEYVESEIVGTQEKPENLIYPQQIILHEDALNHKVLYPGHYFYRLILGQLQSHSFEGLRVSDKSAILLRRMMNQQSGVEIHFSSNIPVELIRHVLPFQAGTLEKVDWIRTIWMTENDGETEIYLIGQDFTDAYEVVRTDLLASKIQEYIVFGQYQYPNYLVSEAGYLYPDEVVSVFRITHPISSLTSDKMQNMLFPDPGITRNWTTSEGMEIYSDGKRGLEIDTNSQWMSFTDPAASIANAFEPVNDLAAAVQFVNQHGGWNGKFNLEKVELDLLRQEPRFTFRQYLNSFPAAYPIINPDKVPFGEIEVKLERDVVTVYERSLLIAESDQVVRSDYTLPGGDVLKRRLDRLGLSTRIETVTPAFRAKMLPDAIEFVPIWGVYLSDGTLIELP